MLASVGSRRLAQRLVENGVRNLVGVIFRYGEVLVMWLTLALIIYIRQRAKQISGPSYQVQSLISISLEW